MNFTVLSQIDTQIDTNKDSLICFPKSIVRKIQKDLIQKDYNDSIIEYNNSLIDTLNLKISDKDTIINSYKLKINLYESSEKDYTQIIKLKDKTISDREKEIKKQKFQKKLFSISGIFLFVIGLFLGGR